MKNSNEIAKVKEWFIENNLPYFAVHTTKTDRVWWNTSIDDIDEAAAKLDKFLNRNEAGTYTLYVYDKKTSKEPAGTLKFRFYQAFENSGYDSQEDFYKNKYPVQAMLLEQMKELTAEVKLLKERAEIIEDSEDDDEISEQSQPANVIGAIIANPGVQSFLMNFLTNITANLMTPMNHKPQNVNNLRPQAMAGTEPTPDSNDMILCKLFEKGVTWNDLAILANLPTDKITWLLQMLRNGI